MKIEDQACSLELAKKLKELGVKQESAFYWIGKLPFDGFGKVYYELHRVPLLSEIEVYSAFTVAEALEDLMNNCEQKMIVEIYQNAGKSIAMCEYGSAQERTLANAVCELWSGLIKKGIVKP